MNVIANDLLMALLTLNPDKRISAEKALQHAYVVSFHGSKLVPNRYVAQENITVLHECWGIQK